MGELFISSDITMKKPPTYAARLKKMKSSVEILKGELLSEDGFPDDVSYLGSPDLVHMDEERNYEHVDPPENKAGGKSGKRN